MSKRYGNAVKPSVANVQAVEHILSQVGCKFNPRINPFEALAGEIEKCSRKICRKANGSDGRHAKKARRESVGKSSDAKSRPVANGQSREEIEITLNGMKYRDIQLQCKEYGLVAAGNKAVLRERLLTYLMENQDDAPDSEKDRDDVHDDSMQVDKKEEDLPPAEVEDEINAEPIPMKEGSPARVSINSASNPRENEAKGNDGESENDVMEIDEKVKDPPGRAISETSVEEVAADPSMKSPLASFVKDAAKHMASSAKKLKTKPETESQDASSPPPSDLTTSSTSSKISGTRVREIVSKLSSNPTQTNSVLSNKLQAKKDARMARLAEMREKSQLGKTMTSNPVHSGALSSGDNKVATTQSTKKNLAAQMREKALRKENIPLNDKAPGSQPNQSMNRKFGLSSAIVPDSLGSTIKSSTLGMSLKTFSAKKAKSPPKPSETYEISDREESDSDDSDSENQKSKKAIPAWARRDLLVPALEAQYLGEGTDGQKVDPDEIFCEVQTCDLEAIFGNQMRSKYKTRTSSGNWAQDRVTAAEKLVYKRTMGFADAV